jgi:hypothetical protein
MAGAQREPIAAHRGTAHGPPDFHARRDTFLSADVTATSVRNARRAVIVSGSAGGATLRTLRAMKNRHRCCASGDSANAGYERRLPPR